MTLRVADRVRDVTTTTGTGALTISGTPPQTYRTFSAIPSIANGDTFVGMTVHQTANEWETGLYTYTNSTTITRTTIYASSNAGAAVNFSAGTKDVVLVQSAVKSVWKSIETLGETITANAPLISGSQTWNGPGQLFYGLDFDFTVTSMDLNSRILRIKINGSEYFAINWDGSFLSNGGINILNSFVVTSSDYNARIWNGAVYGWSSTSVAYGTLDTGLSRVSPGVVAVGNGVAGNASGMLNVARINNNNTNLIIGGSIAINYNGTSAVPLEIYGLLGGAGGLGQCYSRWHSGGSADATLEMFVDDAGGYFYTRSAIPFTITANNSATGLRVRASNDVEVQNTTASVSPASGALIVAGGAGIGGKLYTGSDIQIVPSSGGAYLHFNPTAASQQATFFFNQSGVSKWQLGKQTDDSFLLWDAINSLNVMNIGTGGASSPVSFSRTITSTGDIIANSTLQAPRIIGGGSASSTLTLDSTYAAGTSDAIIMRSGSQVERLRLNTQGSFIIGGNYGNGFTENAHLNIKQNATAATGAWGLSLEQFSNDNLDCAILWTKSRGTTVGTHARANNDDKVGALDFKASTGSAYWYTGWFDCFVDSSAVGGAASATNLPGRFVFSVSPANWGSTNPSPRRLSITSKGQLIVNEENRNDIVDDAYVVVKTTDGTNLPGGFEARHFSNTAFGTWISVHKSRATTIDGIGRVALDDDLGGYFWDADAGGTTGALSSAAIRSFVDATTVADQRCASRMIFYTAPNNGSLTERLRINSSGHIIATSASATPPTLATNGQWVMTPTSNTNMRISHRGSDGVTRVGNITLA